MSPECMPVRMTRSPSRVRGAADRDLTASVDRAVRDRIERSPYAFYFNRVMWRLERRHLILNGCVPTFYMKQILQTTLRDIDGVKQIVNDVNVVNSTRISHV